MSKVGISDAAARHLIKDLGTSTDELRTQVNSVEQHITELAGAHYVSATTEAYRNKWESQVKPQFTKILNQSDQQQASSTSYFDKQQASLREAASTIQAV